jgi:hypothetical protein
VKRVPLLSGSRLVIANAPDDAVILRPPAPREAIADVRGAVRDALRFPLVGPPLEALVRRGGRATIVIEPPSVPIPTAQNDPRQAAIATVVDELARAGVPVGVLAAPVIPGLTDHEIPSIIDAATQAGARHAGYVMLRLPHGVGPLFERWLTQHFPERKDKVLHRIRAMRGGRLNDPRFTARMKGEGIFAEQIEALFALACHKAGIDGRGPRLSTAGFRVPSQAQLWLFE